MFIDFKSNASTLEAFCTDLNAQMSKTVRRLRFDSSQSFDHSNLLANEKRMILYLDTQSENFLNVPKLNDINGNSYFRSFMTLINLLNQNGVVSRNINPSSLRFNLKSALVKGTEEGLRSKNNSILKKLQFEGSMSKKISTKKSKVNETKKRSQDESFNVGRHVKDFCRMISQTEDKPRPANLDSELYLLKSNNMNSEQILELELVDYRFGSIRNLNRFKAKLDEVNYKFIQFIRSSRINVNYASIDMKFDFFEYLKNMLGIELESTKIRSKKNLIYSDLSIAASRVESGSHKGKCTPRQPDYGRFDQNSPQSQFTPEDPLFHRLEGEHPKSSMWSEIRNLFKKEPDTKRPEGKESYQIRVKKEISKIQKMRIVNKPKYASILSVLKIDCAFLDDIESSFYTMLDLANLYPKDILNRKKGNLVDLIQHSEFVDFGIQSISSKDLFESNHQTFLECEHIDLLLSILANIEIEDFPRNEKGIIWFFDLEKAGSRNILDMKINLQRSWSRKKVDDSELGRFKRLEYLTEQVNDKGKYLLKRVFKLENIHLEYLLIKISNKFARCLPYYLSMFVQNYRKLFLKFLIQVMLSKKYSFFHKFCVVMMLKSNVKKQFLN